MTIYQNTLAGSGFLQGATGAPGPAANTIILEYEYIATQGQTLFSGNDKYGNSLSYTANGIFVALNGSLLNELEEYSALDGSTVTLNQAAASNDELIVYTFPPFNVANTYTQQQANTIFVDRVSANTLFFANSGGTLTGNVSFANAVNFKVPVGNTAQRPAASQGYIRYNTDLNTLESANATAWSNVGSGSASSGGGGVSWQSVQNTNFIAVAGNGYGVNTATGNVTVTLPSTPSAGQQIQFLDYGQTFSANGLILYPNGNKLLGNTANITISSSGTSVGLVYFDANKGWVPYTGFPSSIVGSYAINYLIVAGGGGGGLSSPNYSGGGGGAGGLISGTGINVTPGTQYSVVVGGGASIQVSNSYGNNGSNSTAFGYVALGGGGGGGGTSSTPSPAPSDGRSGGSGGGSAHNGSTGSSPAGSGTVGQGNPGGTGFLGSPAYGGGGGGGSGSPGANGTTNSGGNGGSGTTWSNGTTYAGGGGGGSNTPGPAGSGGSGGGGPGGYVGAGTSGSTNTGGGGGGYGGQNVSGGAGGSGIVIIQYQGNLQRATGGNVSISGGYVYHTFNSSGTFVG